MLDAGGPWPRARYQGHGEHLWAYQPATGKVRSSGTPCCQYIGMLTFPARPG